MCPPCWPRGVDQAELDVRVQAREFDVTPSEALFVGGGGYPTDVGGEQTRSRRPRSAALRRAPAAQNGARDEARLTPRPRHLRASVGAATSELPEQDRAARDETPVGETSGRSNVGHVHRQHRARFPADARRRTAPARASRPRPAAPRLRLSGPLGRFLQSTTH